MLPRYVVPSFGGKFWESDSPREGGSSVYTSEKVRLGEFSHVAMQLLTGVDAELSRSPSLADQTTPCPRRSPRAATRRVACRSRNAADQTGSLHAAHSPLYASCADIDFPAPRKDDISTIPRYFGHPIASLRPDVAVPPNTASNLPTQRQGGAVAASGGLVALAERSDTKSQDALRST